MARYVLKRLVGVVLVLVLVLTLVFFMLHAMPGGPELAYLGTNPTPEKRAAVMEQLGLDSPLGVQYLAFLGSVFTLDFGTSLTTNAPVSELLDGPDAGHARAGPGLVRGLDVRSACCSAPWPRPARAACWTASCGSAASWRCRSPASGSDSSWSWSSACTSPGILPSSGWVPFTEDPVENLRSLVLPAFTLGIGAAAVIARTLRSSMITALESDHVAFGRAMGMPERSLLSKLALRNAVIPTLTVIGMMLGSFIGGSVLVENVFNVPGIGQLIVTSFVSHDYPVAIAATVWTAGTFLVTTLVVDLLYFAINPRIRAQFTVGAR